MDPLPRLAFLPVVLNKKKGHPMNPTPNQTPAGGLKACPLCGGNPQEEATAMEATIRCRACRLYVSVSRGPLDAHKNEAMPAVRLRWNARASSTGPGVTEESLQRALDAYSETFLSRSEKYDADAHAKAMRNALEAALGGMGEGKGWVSVKAKMPDEDTTCLVHDGKQFAIAWMPYSYGMGRKPLGPCGRWSFAADCWEQDGFRVKFWRPLPAPPSPVGGV